MAGTSYGGVSWVILFVLCGLLFVYCMAYQVFPRWLKFRHWMFKRRVNATLDVIDQAREDLEMQQVDPITGEVYRAKDRLSGEQAGGDAGLGLDLEALVVLETGEGKDESECIGDGSPQQQRRKGGGGKREKRLTPKRLAEIEQKRQEKAAWEESCRRALYIPLREERLRIVRDSFEKRIEGGHMGWQLTVEYKKKIGHEVINGMQLRDGRIASFFHKLAFEERKERGRPKEHHRPRPRDPNDPKRRAASPPSPNRGTAAGMGSCQEGSCGARKQSPPRQRSPSPCTSPRRETASPEAGVGDSGIPNPKTTDILKEWEESQSSYPEAIVNVVSEERPIPSSSEKLRGRVVALKMYQRAQTAPDLSGPHHGE